MAGIKDTASTQHSALSRHKTKASKSKPRKRKARARKPAAGPIVSSPIEFPEFKGKTIADLKLYLHLDDTGISVDFTDKTHANFSLEPRLTVRTALADISTGNWRDIKNWPVMISESGHLDD